MTAGRRWAPAAVLAVATVLATAMPASGESTRPAADPGGYGVDCASKGYLIDRLPEAMRVIADLDGRPAAAFVAMLLGRISAESVLVIANPETALAGVYGFDTAGCAYPDGYVLPLEQAERLLRKALHGDAET